MSLMASEPRSRKVCRMDAAAVEDEGERIAVEPFHRLRQRVVDELLKHRSIHSSHRCALPLGRREHLGQQGLDARADGDHVVASSVGRSLCRDDEGLLARQREGAIRSGGEAKSSLIEKEDAGGGDALQLASHVCDLVTQPSRHCTSSQLACSLHAYAHSFCSPSVHSLSSAVLFLVCLALTPSSSFP